MARKVRPALVRRRCASPRRPCLQRQARDPKRRARQTVTNTQHDPAARAVTKSATRVVGATRAASYSSTPHSTGYSSGRVGNGGACRRVWRGQKPGGGGGGGVGGCSGRNGAVKHPGWGGGWR